MWKCKWCKNLGIDNENRNTVLSSLTLISDNQMPTHVWFWTIFRWIQKFYVKIIRNWSLDSFNLISRYAFMFTIHRKYATKNKTTGDKKLTATISMRVWVAATRVLSCCFNFWLAEHKQARNINNNKKCKMIQNCDNFSISLLL